MKKISLKSLSGSPRSAVRAFTLIELLIVIAIIGLLTGIIMVSLTGSKSKSRDVKRISDLGAMQNALELYFDRCKAYPSSTAFVLTDNNAFSGTCSVTLGDFISVKPVPPVSSPATPYLYTPSGTPPNSYILRVTLENFNEILNDDIDGSGCGSNNGVLERDYCLGPR